MKSDLNDDAETASVAVIAVSGPTRSGKSLIASSVASALQAQDWRCEVLCQDDFWVRIGQRDVDGESVMSEEETTCTDWGAFVAAAREARCRLGRALSQAKEIEGLEQRRGLLILEGFQVLHDESLRGMCTHMFHLDLPREEVIRRRSSEDTPERPNPRPCCERYCQLVVWPAHCEYEKRCVDGQQGITRLDMMVADIDIYVQKISQCLSQPADHRQPDSPSSSLDTKNTAAFLILSAFIILSGMKISTWPNFSGLFKGMTGKFWGRR